MMAMPEPVGLMNYSHHKNLGVDLTLFLEGVVLKH